MQSKKTAKSDKPKTIFSKNNNKTMESLRLEELMDEKWSIHAAIKSSLDLFERSKVRPEIENQEDHEEQKVLKMEKQSSKEEESNEFKRETAMLLKVVFFRRFERECRDRVRRRHHNYAAKYFWEQRLKRKVLLDRCWRAESDKEFTIKVDKLEVYLEGKRKREVYSVFNSFVRIKEQLETKIEELNRCVKAKLFKNKGFMQQQIERSAKKEDRKKESVEVKLKQYEELKEFSAKKSSKYSMKEKWSRQKGETSAKKQYQQQQEQSESYQSYKHKDNTNHHQHRGSAKSVLEIKEAIKVDDIRNIINSNKALRFINNLRFLLSLARINELPNKILVKQKKVFMRNLIFKQKQQSFKSTRHTYIILETLRRLNQNKKAAATKTKQVKLFVRRSLKHKLKAFELLSENRERRMLSDLCLSIITTRRVAHIQLKVLCALKMNLQRSSVKRQLVKQIELRRQQGLVRKVFMRWKYYRPEYLDMTCQKEEIECQQEERYSVKSANKRQREEIGAPDILKDLIKEVTQNVFFMRLKSRVQYQVREKQRLARCSMKVQQFCQGSKSKFSSSMKSIVERGFEELKRDAELSSKQRQVEFALVNSKVQKLFKQKFVSPKKFEKLKLELKKRLTNTLLNSLQCIVEESRDIHTKVLKVLGSRLFSKITKQKQSREEAKQKVKYLSQLLFHSQDLKLKYHFFNQLRLCSDKSLDIHYSQLTGTLIEHQFREFVQNQSQKVKEYCLVISRKRLFWKKFSKRIRGQGQEGRGDLSTDKSMRQVQKSLQTQRQKQFILKLTPPQSIKTVKTEILTRFIQNQSKRSFLDQLKCEAQIQKDRLHKKITRNKLQQYAERKYNTRLCIKSFLSLKKNQQQSAKEGSHSLLPKTFSALKDHLHQSRLLKRYLDEYSHISFFPESQQQKDEFDLLKQYIDV